MIFEETFKKNNKQISYIRYGEWTKKIILFFHGFTGSKRFIPEKEISSGICILSFDRPGIGKSDIEEYYKMESFLNHINSVLADKNIESVHLIGHSAGGYYAQLYAELYPSKIKSLSLLSSMIPLNSPNTQKILNMQWKIIKFITLHAKRFSKFYFRKMAEDIIKNYDQQFERNLKNISEKERCFMCENFDLIKNAIINSTANNGLGMYYDAYALSQMRECPQQKNAFPVFIWNGTDDNITPISFAQYLNKQYNTTKLHIIENMGHMLYLPCWDKILEEILTLDKDKN